MANVVAGYTYLSATDPATHTKANLQSLPTVTIGTNEIILSNLPTAAANNTFLARYTTGSGNYEALVTTTTGLGYYVGAGGTVTQATNKSTTVVLSKMCGAITMNNAALNLDVAVSFTLTNTLIAATDLLILNHVSGGTAGAYTLNAQCGTGSAVITVRNVTTGNLSEAIVIGFAVFKSQTS